MKLRLVLAVLALTGAAHAQKYRFPMELPASGTKPEVTHISACGQDINEIPTAFEDGHSNGATLYTVRHNRKSEIQDGSS